MKIIKNEIRPIGFITLEMTEIEIQTIISVLDEICLSGARTRVKEIINLIKSKYE